MELARDAETLSKSCAYRLLQLLQEVVSLRNLRESDDDAKVIQDLQRKLLGCLTDSILIANASSSSCSTASGIPKKDGDGVAAAPSTTTSSSSTSSSRRKVSDYFRSNFTIHR